MAKNTAVPEPTYTRADLVDGAVSFGVTPEVMAGALHLAGREQFTRAQAEAALKAFRERKV